MRVEPAPAAPKVSPAALAGAIVKALQDGVEDVYPAMCAGMAGAMARQSKALERELSA
jgi:hypothetical protein